MNNLKKYKNEFLKYLQVLNRSQNTIKYYDLIINYYQDFLKNNNINKKNYFILQTIIEYKKYLDCAKNKKFFTDLKESTKTNFFSKLSVFFRYLLDNNIIFFNPFDKIDKIKKAKVLPKNIPNQDEVNKILNSISMLTKCGYRDRTIFELVYSTGIRRMEITNLTLFDIDLNNGFIQIKKGKGAKDRIAPVGKTACEFLSYYIREIRTKMLKGNNYEQILFVNNRGKKLTLAGVCAIFRYRGIKSGLKKNFSCHSFRHACATDMLKGKASIKHIQDMLGHSYLSSTQIYTHIQPVDLLEVHKKTHPSWNLFDESENDKPKNY